MADEPVSLTVVMNEVEAGMIRGLLASAGIESMERPSSTGAGVAPGLTPGGATEIFVHRSQLVDAQALIQADSA